MLVLAQRTTPCVSETQGSIAAARAAAEALGIRNGPTYTQIRVGEDGCRVVELAARLGLPVERFEAEVARYNAACSPGRFDHAILDGNATSGIVPPKTNWALPIDTPPFYGYALRPGITFTYLGLKTDAQARVYFGGAPSDNLFVAGEMMAGNVLGKGYTAGVGMSIGTAFGRIAGTEAARAARNEGTLAVA